MSTPLEARKKMKKSFKKIITIVIMLGIFFSVIVFTDFFKTKEAEAGWYATGGTWSYRKTITIDHTRVEGTSDLTNFPVLIDMTDSGLQANAQADGDDILFTSADGTTKLDHEIEIYTTATGRLTAWVEIPTLDYNDNTTIYMYYGNSGASSQQNATGVWDSNYVTVYHYPDGTTFSANESTSNDLNGTNTGVSATSGKIDGAGSWDGGASTDKITATVTASATKTWQAWVYMNAIDTTARRIWEHGGLKDQVFIYTVTGLDYQVQNSGGGTAEWKASAPSTGEWVHIVIAHDGSSTANDPVIYYNGVSQTVTEVTAPTSAASTGSATLTVGNRSLNDRAWNGKIDELRFSNIVRSADWIKTEYNNQSATSTFYGISGVEDTVSDTNIKANKATIWKDASWGYAKKITIDHTKVSGTANLNNFPMLVSLTDNDLRYTSHGGYVGKEDGTDIFFVGENGNKLDHEIEKYASTTGELIAWVRMPALYPVNNTNIIMYFGNSVASDQQNITGVWDSYYKGVWHFPNGTTLSTLNTITNDSGTTSGTPVAGAGKIDGSMDMDVATDYLNAGTSSEFNFTSSAFTLEAWIKPPSSGQADWEVFMGRGDWRTDGWYIQTDNSATKNGIYVVTNQSGSDQATIASGKLTLNTWNHVVAVRNGTSIRIYVNGTDQTTSAASHTNPTSNSKSLYIGGWINAMDEVRISNTNRSADWIATEYNNQSATSTFYTVGSLLTPGSIETASAPASTKIKVRGGVKFR